MRDDGGEALRQAVHELSEGLQATGSYLSALRHKLGAGHEAELVERALHQWLRARAATQTLRSMLRQSA